MKTGGGRVTPVAAEQSSPEDAERFHPTHGGWSRTVGFREVAAFDQSWPSPCGCRSYDGFAQPATKEQSLLTAIPNGD